MNLNYTAIDVGSGLVSCWYNIRNATSTIVDNTSLTDLCNNLTFSLPGYDDNYVLTVCANDSNSEIGCASKNFSINTRAPETLILTSYFKKELGSAINIDYYTYDQTAYSCFFTLRDVDGNVHNYAANTSLTCGNGTKQISVLSEGVYTFTLQAIDTGNLYNYSNLTFEIIPVVQSGGSSGGGGGGTTEINIINVTGNLSVNPAMIDSVYLNFHFVGNESAVWTYVMTANMALGSCEVTNNFSCAVRGNQVNVSKTFTGVNEAVSTQDAVLTLYTPGGDALTLNVRVRMFNAGLYVPVSGPEIGSIPSFGVLRTLNGKLSGINIFPILVLFAFIGLLWYAKESAE